MFEAIYLTVSVLVLGAGFVVLTVLEARAEERSEALRARIDAWTR